MSKVKRQQMLTQQLASDHPIFKLKKIGAKVAGSIISSTFRGKSDRVRQKMIWSALDAEMGTSSVNEVGTLLAYTPDEWDVELPLKAG